MAKETELKFELTPQAAEALAGSDLLGGAPQIAQQHSVYFDTPDLTLQDSGFSLRIRQTGEKRIQTIKAAPESAAGLFVRSEWELPVKGDLPIVDGSTPLGTLPGLKRYELGPAFFVDVERRRWDLSWQGAEIEFVLDRGEVVAADRRTPVCEIELELKSGPVAALFALARGIDAIAPLQPGVLTKAERGYRLLGPAEQAAKAGPVALAADMDATAVLRRIAGACVRQFRLNARLAGQRNSDALHQTRVALRRLRSALSIHKGMLEDAKFQHLRDELRWLAGALADAREIDVLLMGGHDETARERLESARGTAYEAAEHALESARARMLMLDLSEWLAVGGWLALPETEAARTQPAEAFAAAALERMRKKVRTGGRKLATLEVEARHEVRKDAKKLRYAAEFFAPLFDGKGRKPKRFIGALADLQDDLGALNDLAGENAVLARIGVEAAPARHKKSRERDALKAAIKSYDAFAAAKPFWR